MSQNKTKLILLVVGVLGLVVSGLSAYLATHIPLIWQISLALGLAALVGSAWIARGEMKAHLSRRNVQYGLNSVLMSLVAFAIVIVLNLIASNHDLKIDITKNKLHTLSDQTVKVLKGLSRDVTLKAFISPMQMAEYNTLLDKYAYHSKHIKKEFVDLDKDPLAVQKNEIRQPGTIIVESETRSAKVDNLSGGNDPKFEEKLTNAIIQVEKGNKKKIYFLTGHGERLISDSAREGYTGMRDALSAGRFAVEELNLAEKDKIPADAEIVVMAGPRKEFLAHELAEVDAYLKRGGKVMLMVEPDSTKALAPFLAKYGVTWKPGAAVFERNRLQQLAGGNPLTPVVVSYEAGHDITKEAKQMSIFAIATPIEKAEKAPDGVTVSPLFSSSRASLEAVLTGDKVNVNEKGARKGPLNLAVAVTGKADQAAKPEKSEEKKEGEEAKGPEFRLVVVGDSDFGSNALRGYGINSDLFQNTLSWLAKEEDLISIRPKPTDETEFDITAQRYRVIFLASVFLMPLLMMASGISVWFTRRRK